MGKRRPLLCSTGAFTRSSDLASYQAILHYGPLLAVDGLEVMFYPSWYPTADMIAADLRASGLRFSVLHTEKSIGPALGSAEAEERTQAINRLEANCHFASQIGVRLIVRRRGNKAGFEQSMALEVGEPFTVLCIRLAPRDRLDVVDIDQQDGPGIVFKGIVERIPEHPG